MYHPLKDQYSFNAMRGFSGVGGRGSGYHPENLKAKGFLGNTGPDPLKNHKATTPAFNVGPLSLVGR